MLLPPDLPDAPRRLLAVSPLVERRGQVAFLDVRGTERLHGGTAGIFAALTRALLPDRPLGLGLAGNRFTAEVAARASGRLAKGALAVDPGDEALFLSRLPLGLLPASPALLRRLVPLGLETLGDFASLPVASVSRRFGAEGVALHRLARGEDEAGLLPDAQHEPLSVLQQPLHPLPDLERLAPVLGEAVARLCAALDEHGLGAVRLRLDLTLDDDRCESWPLVPALPESRTELLRDLLLLALTERPPRSSVVELLLTAEETARPGVHQNVLLGEQSRDESRRAEALSRLQGCFGAQALARPQLRAAHRMEDRWRVQESAAPLARQRSPQSAAAPTLKPTLRWLHEPRLLVPVRAGDTLLAFRLGRQELVIAALSAPRRLEGGWWCDPWARDEYDLLTPDGALYRICRDMAARRWLLLAEHD